MMGLSGNWGLWSVGLNLHCLFGLMVIVGVIMFVVWAVKNLSKGDLKKWSIGLVIVGVLGVLLTSGIATRGMYSMMSGLKNGTVDWNQMMDWDDDSQAR